MIKIVKFPLCLKSKCMLRSLFHCEMCLNLFPIFSSVCLIYLSEWFSFLFRHLSHILPLFPNYSSAYFCAIIFDYFLEMVVFFTSARAFRHKFRFHKIGCRICTQKNIKDFWGLNILLGRAWGLVGFEGSFPFAASTLSVALFFVHVCKVNINYYFRDRLRSHYLPLKLKFPHGVTQGIKLWKNLFQPLCWHCNAAFHLVMILQAFRKYARF
jgi:hypothetical protein